MLQAACDQQGSWLAHMEPNRVLISLGQSLSLA